MGFFDATAGVSLRATRHVAHDLWRNKQRQRLAARPHALPSLRTEPPLLFSWDSVKLRAAVDQLTG